MRSNLMELRAGDLRSSGEGGMGMVAWVVGGEA